MTEAERFRLLVAGVRWPAEAFIERKLAGLAQRGFDVTVAARTPRRMLAHRVRGVEVVRLPHSGDSAPATLVRGLRDTMRAAFAEPRAAALLARAQRQEAVPTRVLNLCAYAPLAALRPHAVHFEWNSAVAEYAPLLPVWNCPVVVSCRGSQVNVRPWVSGTGDFRKTLEDSFASATVVHCVSEAIRREAVSLGLDPGKARVVRNGADTSFFRPPSKRASAPGRLRIASTGSLLWVKGYEFALLAVKRLVEAGVDASYEIVGDGPKTERQRVQFAIHDLGLNDRVLLHGKLAAEGVRDVLHRSDVFVLSSVSEGISNAALEAMATGMPVVTTNCGGMSEAVADGVEGFVVPVRSPDAMAEALQRLTAHAELREEMGRNARARAVREFSLDRMLDELAAMYWSLRPERAVAAGAVK